LRTCQELLAVDGAKHANVSNTVSQLETKRQRNLQTQGDITVPVLVVLLEDVGHTLEADASLDEEVEAHSVFVAAVVGAEQQLHELRRQPIAEGHKRLAELVVRDVARPVHVEPVEQVPPRCQEAPQPAAVPNMHMLEPRISAPVPRRDATRYLEDLKKKKKGNAKGVRTRTHQS